MTEYPLKKIIIYKNKQTASSAVENCIKHYGDYSKHLITTQHFKLQSTQQMIITFGRRDLSKHSACNLCVHIQIH